MKNFKHATSQTAPYGKILKLPYHLLVLNESEESIQLHQLDREDHKKDILLKIIDSWTRENIT